MPRSHPLTRRALLASSAAMSAAALLPPAMAAAEEPSPLAKPIPATGERLPAIGLGTWITFNVGDDALARDACAEVMRAFFDGGGRLIDSSPMYGSSEAVIGHGIGKLGRPPGLFSATKVWTWSGAAGPGQIEDSRRLWGLERFDLVQVHNLLSWEAHLETLLAMKAEGRVRHVGITTSHGRRHEALEAIMRTRPIDFVQVTYNALDREVERRILPLAAERGIAVIANRPFRGGSLIRSVEDRPLPPWAAEIDAASWAQILLKLAVSHPAVTCAIPATTRVDHVRQNVGAAYGRMPDERMRARMLDEIEAL
jgi:diketogulonate reductase-like aldo/keto reductase